MAEFVITHRIEAPELCAALNNLADALKMQTVAAPAVQNEAQPVQNVIPFPAAETPVQAPEMVSTTAPTTPVDVPVTVGVNGATSATTNAPAPTPAPDTATAPVTAATSEKVYTFEDITAAGSQLLEMNKMSQLMELLKGYGVQAVTQLKPEQYADVAAGLRGLGAKI